MSETMEEALRSGRVTFTHGAGGWLQDCIFYLCNNHILLAVFLAHPAHPYPRMQRGMVLFNSLAFAFFVTAVLHALIPAEVRGLLHLTLGTVLQLLFDVPASMLGTCPCAHRALPEVVQNACRGTALCCLSLHTCLAVVFAVVGAGFLALTSLLGRDDDAVWDGFIQTKASAFASAVPTAVFIYALLRQCEAGGPAGPML